MLSASDEGHETEGKNIVSGTGDGEDENNDDIEAMRADLAALAEDILERSAKLLDELQQFEDLRKSLRKELIGGMSGLIRVTSTEHKAAQHVLQELGSPDADVKKLARIRYSNLPAQERDWSVIKRCRWLCCVGQSFSAPRRSKNSAKRANKGGRQGSRKDDSIFVDASVDGGAEWLRIINIDEKRLLYEMADGGWDWGAGDDGSGDESSDDEVNEDDDEEEDIALMRTVKNLVQLSRVTTFNYQHPRVHVLLTRIEEGSNHEIDRLLRKLRALGGEDVVVVVDCSNSEYTKAPVPPLETALSNLLSEDMRDVTSTVVIDTSILIALASDVSHSKVKIQDWHRSDLQAQIREEAEGRSFLLANAYPLLRSRKLVCTQLAAKHYREIVSTIGTEAEKARAELLLSSDLNGDGPESHDTVAELQKLSIYPVPPDLQLPIRILGEDAEVNTQAAIEAGSLPPAAQKVESELLDLASNRATFMYGWLSGNTVITSNNTLAKQMVRIIETNRRSRHEIGPKVWVFSFNRALSTKGKPHGFDMANSRRRRKGKQHKESMTTVATERESATIET